MAQKLKDYYGKLEREVSRQKEELKRNRAFEAQKDDFLNIASHELKTPLTSLKIFSSLLKRMALKDRRKEYARYGG